MKVSSRLAAMMIVALVPVLGLALQAQAPTAQAPPGKQAPRAAAATRPMLAIKGATILTVTKGTIPNGVVLVRDGKVAAVGANVEIPANAEIVDAAGKYVTPGLIDEHSHIAEDSTNEGGTTVSSMTNVLDVLDPTDVNIYRDLAGGLTVASVFHGSANPIGGTNTVIKLRWGKRRAEELVFDAGVPGLKFALGENPKAMRTGMASPGPQRYPASRPGVEFVIRDAFTRAREYRRAWLDYEKRCKAGEDILAPRRDLQLDPLVEVLEGKRLAHVHAYRADEMLMILRLAEEFGFKVATFEHGLEGYKVAKELAAHGAGVGTFSDWWGYKIEAIDAIPYNAAIMLKAGVVVSINSDSAEHARRLNTEAAKMMHWGGLTEDQALALVTINPARQLHVDKRVGSIEAGKDADLVLWTTHPLSSYAVVDRTYIDGTLYYDREADLARVRELEKEKARLVAAEKAERENAKKPADGTANETRPDVSRLEDASGIVVAGEHDLHDLYPKMTAGRLGKGVLAIANAKIVPVSSPSIERGTIVIRDGRIESVGASVPVPAGAKVIDAAGAEVYPGWINAKTTLGLAEPGARGYEDTTEMLDYNPQLRTVVAYHNDSESIPVARANGVTAVAVFPNGGLLGGQVPVMTLDGWTWEESALDPLVGVSFQFPGVAAGGGRGARGGSPDAERTYEQLKRERDARLDALLRLLDEARAYAKAPAAQRRTDWVLQALVPVVNRRIPLFTTALRAQDIRDAVAFADRARVRMVICSGPEAALVAPLLKEKNVPVILGSILALPTREDQFHAASYQAAGELAKAGVRFAFATGDNANVRQVPYQAAMSVAWGLPREDALKALTTNAAEILGVGDRLGSIEPGKVANLIVAAGDPLEVRTAITHVIINGQEMDLANKHLALYERYLKRE